MCSFMCIVNRRDFFRSLKKVNRHPPKIIIKVHKSSLRVLKVYLWRIPLQVRLVFPLLQLQLSLLRTGLKAAVTVFKVVINVRDC